MTERQCRIEHTTVADLVKSIGDREIPMVKPEALMADIVAAFARAWHARLVYVVDEHQQLLGVISLGNLAKHLLFHFNRTEIDNLHLVRMAVAETARDYIDKPSVAAQLTDNIEQLLIRMLESGVKEVPVVDEQGRLIADLTLVDIFTHCGGDLHYQS